LYPRRIDFISELEGESIDVVGPSELEGESIDVVGPSELEGESICTYIVARNSYAYVSLLGLLIRMNLLT